MDLLIQPVLQSSQDKTITEIAMKLFTVLFLSSFLGFSFAQDHSQHHKKEKAHHDKTMALTLNNGKKWEVDQVMKENMEAIHTEYEKTHALHKKKKAAAADYETLSTTITQSAEKIAANCKMEKKMDDTFHVLLGDMMSGAEELKDQAKSNKTKAMEKIHHSLHNYKKYFNHNF